MKKINTTGYTEAKLSFVAHGYVLGGMLQAQRQALWLYLKQEFVPLSTLPESDPGTSVGTKKAAVSLLVAPVLPVDMAELTTLHGPVLPGQ